MDAPPMPGAIGRPDTGSNAVFLPRSQFFANLGVGNMGAGHADHIQQPVCDGIAGGCHIVDPRGMEDRLGQHALHRGHMAQLRGQSDMHAGHIICQSQMRINPPKGQVEEIDQSTAVI